MTTTATAARPPALRGLTRAADVAGRLAAPMTLAIVLVMAAISIRSFFTPGNLATVLIQASVLGMVALGQTLVLLVRGIDMSVSAVMPLGVVLVLSVGHSLPVLEAGALACVIALAIGTVNGLLVTRRQVPPFIATFGMLVFVEGLRLAYTHGQASGTVPHWLRAVGVGQTLHIPNAFLIWIVVTLLATGALLFTTYGRWVQSIGASPEASRYAGVPVNRVVVACYALCSLLALCGGMLLSGYLGYVDQYLGANYNLNSIAAGIVGGVTFTGGKGNFLGAAVGVLLLVVLINLVVVAGLGISWQFIVEGAVLVLAVALQGLRVYLASR